MLYTGKRMIALLIAALIVTGSVVSGCSSAKQDDIAHDTSNAKKKGDDR